MDGWKVSFLPRSCNLWGVRGTEGGYAVGAIMLKHILTFETWKQAGEYMRISTYVTRVTIQRRRDDNGVMMPLQKY